MGDEQQYWDAMAALRDEGQRLRVSFLAPTVSTCAPSVNIRDGDNAYWQYCVSPILFFNVAGSGQSELSYCFQLAYFQWAQRYLREALRRKPPAGASTRARVLWTLDVWSHLVYGLLALNVDLRSGVNRVGPPTDNWLSSQATGRTARTQSGGWAHPVYVPFRAAQQARVRSNELLRSTERSTMRNEQMAEWREAVMMPTPFWELPFDWISNLDPSGAVKDQNPLWATLYNGVMPWAQNGVRVLSYGSKDAAELRAALNNQALYHATLQWRMMCLQDWGAARFGRETPLGGGSRAWLDWWPLSMGTRHSSPTLSAYIRSVHYSERGKLVMRSGSPARLYPTFAVAFNSIDSLVGPFLSMNYSQALKLQTALWAQAAVRTNRGLPAVTYTDSNDYVRAHADAVQARAETAITNPRVVRDVDLATGHEEGAVEEATNDLFFDGVSIGGQEVIPPLYDFIAENPVVKPWLAAFQRIFTEIVRAVGAATGGAPTWPLIPHPFVRSLQAAGWNAAADGSSVDVIAKITVAIKNIEVATNIDMGVYVGEWQPSSAARTTVHDPARCRVVVHPTSGDFVTQCDDDQARPQQQAPPGGIFDRPVSNLEAAACRSQFDIGIAKSPYRHCIGEADYPAFGLLCVSVIRGGTPPTTFDEWAEQMAKLKGCKPATFWSEFIKGFKQRGNPIATFRRN